MSRILIIDNDTSASFLTRLRDELDQEIVTADTLALATRKIRSHAFDLVIADDSPPDHVGRRLLADPSLPALPIVLLTSCGSIRDAVHAIRRGATEYVVKPFDDETLIAVIRKVTDPWAATAHDEPPCDVGDAARAGVGARFIGESAKAKRVRMLIDRVAETRVNVLVLGESGTGKELVARAIHARSSFRRHPLVKVNCPSIPAQLFESSLFGHIKGSFTSAHESHKGKFELAGQGNILLDEVSEIPLDLQAKLLRVLEDRRCYPVGGTTEVSIHARVMAASNRNLAQMVKEGQFRRDLYYRLNVFPIHLAPLRERKEDIPAITFHLLRRLSQLLGIRINGISENGMRALFTYDWPGNVRELRNILERAAVLASGKTLDIEHFPAELQQCAARFAEASDFRGQVDAFKRMLLVDTLRSTGWRKKTAAERLGLTQRAFSHYVARFDLDSEREI